LHTAPPGIYPFPSLKTQSQKLAHPFFSCGVKRTSFTPRLPLICLKTLIPNDRAMTTKSRFDKLLAYLEYRSRLNQDEVSHIQEALGGLEIDAYGKTAVKVMNSGVFSGERFKRKTGERSNHYIWNFEQFIAKVAAAIDEHSDEIQKCLAESSNLKPEVPQDLAERVDSYVKEFAPLEQEIGQLKIIRSDSLAKTRKTLEKHNEDVRKWLSKRQAEGERKHWDKDKIPHQLIEKLRDIIKEHSREITKVLMSRVIVKMLAPFGLKLKESTIRANV
jgi:hypothetical protein